MADRDAVYCKGNIRKGAKNRSGDHRRVRFVPPSAAAIATARCAVKFWEGGAKVERVWYN